MTPQQYGCGDRFRWVVGHGLVPDDPAATGADVVDSWLTDDGETDDLAAHKARFYRSVAAHLYESAARTRQFVEAAVDRIPREGRWFPRVEATARPGAAVGFAIWIRPAPARSDTVRAAVAGPDARTHPMVKGPDLPYLAGLRAAAVAAGADEAVLLDAAGQVVEGTTTSIVWWRGDTLCAPPLDCRRLPGVTRRRLLAAVRRARGAISIEEVDLDALDGLEVWTLNALHGIRPVTEWVDTAIRPGPPVHVGRWAGALAAGRSVARGRSRNRGRTTDAPAAALRA